MNEYDRNIVSLLSKLFRRLRRGQVLQANNFEQFCAQGTGSASTHHEPFALLCDKRRHHCLHGQISTINALGPAAALTRPTLLVQLGWIYIEAFVDTGASATITRKLRTGCREGQSKVRHTWKSTGTYWSQETSFGNDRSV